MRDEVRKNPKKMREEEGGEEEKNENDTEVDVMEDFSVKGHEDPFIKTEEGKEEDDEQEDENPEEELPLEEDPEADDNNDPNVAIDNEGAALKDTGFQGFEAHFPASILQFQGTRSCFWVPGPYKA